MRVLCLFAVATATLVTGCDSQVQQPAENVAAESAPTAEAAPATTPATSAKTPASAGFENTALVEEAPEQDSLTPPQRNAVRSAEQYLRMTSFSRDGLIDQLSSESGEGYSLADATAAVDSLDVDWNENAARSAKQYLDMTGFSCDGLIHQLSSDAGEKYTVEQATYGAHEAGAC